ncbi:MAG TPA: c-type cytochrome biogenesis protein CcsB [Streptosporangiaceae bacterium]|nr:c-type cytochrome biogenesis protein CcsB [Streptosporangiaceae bacterium]
MPVNTGLADASNVLLLSTVILYALAMLCYACDFAFAQQRVLADVPAERVAVGAGGPPVSLPASAPPGPAPVGQPAGRWPQGLWLGTAFGLTCLGLVLQVFAILTRGLAEHRVPWGNMYEFLAAVTCMAVLVLVAASIKYRAYYMGLFVLLPVVLTLGIDLTLIYTPAGSLVPALQSYWIAIHVTAMIVACGLFIFGAVVTTLYLLSDRSERRLAAGRPSWSAGIFQHLPRPAILDRLSYRSILFGFPVWTFGVIAGAIWADHAWGRYWGWDPKETWSFITWVVYAMFLHARATAGWRGRRAAWIHLAAFGCLMFNLIGVNLFITGLHSYAGM